METTVQQPLSISGTETSSITDAETNNQQTVTSPGTSGMQTLRWQPLWSLGNIQQVAKAFGRGIGTWVFTLALDPGMPI